MDIDVNREIRFIKEDKLKNLFKWSLQEFSNEGESVSKKLIPWGWSFNFDLQDFSYRKNYNIKDGNRPIFSKDEDKITDEHSPIESTETELIVALLKPTMRRAFYETTFSMFGTDRQIKSIELQILKNEKQDADEICSLWGSVGYEYELDFRKEYSPDCLIFTITLKANKFDELAAAISANQIESGHLRVGRVKGLYAEWSPEISTNFVKILTDFEHHKVTLPTDCTITPPRIGNVGEVNLAITKKNRLAVQVENEDEVDSTVENRDSYKRDMESLITDGHTMLDSTHSNIQLIYNNLLKSQKLLNSIRIPLWIIAILLLCLLLK